LGLKLCLWPNNGHAKRANLITEWHPQQVTGVTNKNYYSKELDQGFSVLFFSFSTALVIDKIELGISSDIPTCDYIKRLLATTGPPVGIQILEIPTAS
jgi:hypothetical protein